MKKSVSEIKIHLALFSVGLIYAANYSIAKSPMPDIISPSGFVFVRVVSATIVLWIVDLFFPSSTKIKRRDLIRIGVCALFGVVLNQLFFFKGLSMTSTISASVIMTANPVIVLVAAYFILKERITLIKGLGVLLGAVGAVLIITRNQPTLSPGDFLGDLFIFINATSYAIYLILVKPIMLQYRALSVLKWMFLFGCILVIPIGFHSATEVAWTQLPFSAWMSIGYVVVFTTILAFFLNAWGLQYVSPTLVSYYVYVQPVLASLIAILFLDDKPGLDLILFSLLIFAGVYLVSKRTSLDIEG